MDLFVHILIRDGNIFLKNDYRFRFIDKMLAQKLWAVAQLHSVRSRFIGLFIVYLR